jgi:serine/threonine protein kinase
VETVFEDDTPTSLGRYELLTKLATGGMAEIYLARQSGIEGFQRLVVIKRILPHLASQERFVEMFLDEARIAAQLNHPNIVHIYDLGQAGKDFFIAMEYLEGESLGYVARQAVKAGKHLPPGLAAGIVLAVCEGLNFAHEYEDTSSKSLSIVHRDVSPHNIIVLFNGGVKLVDFGIAKANTQAHHTMTGTLKGKPTYMAPEQLLSKPVDARSDIFSLGVVLWELLSRRRLFKRDSDAASIQAVLNEPIPSIREFQPEVPEDFDRIALRALEKDPSDRYQNAGAMAADLDQHLRRSGVPSSSREVAAFMGEVFTNRARSKRQTLDCISQDGIDSVSPEVLKPGSEESFPSASGIVDAAKPDSSAVEVDDEDEKASISTRILDDEAVEVPTRIRVHENRPTMGDGIPLQSAVRQAPGAGSRFWLTRSVLVLLVIAIGLAAWFLARGDGGGDGVADPDKGTRPPAVDPVASRAGPIERPIPPATAPAREIEPGAPAIETPFTKGPEHEAGIPAPPSGQSEPAIRPNHKKKKKKKVRKRKTHRPRPMPSLAEKSRPGILNLNTDPWSEVYLGKRKLGMTPIVGLKLAPGNYTLTAVKEGQGIRKRIRVTIQTSKVTESYVLFEK